MKINKDVCFDFFFSYSATMLVLCYLQLQILTKDICDSYYHSLVP